MSQSAVPGESDLKRAFWAPLTAVAGLLVLAGIGFGFAALPAIVQTVVATLSVFVVLVALLTRAWRKLAANLTVKVGPTIAASVAGSLVAAVPLAVALALLSGGLAPSHLAGRTTVGIGLIFWSVSLWFLFFTIVNESDSRFDLWSAIIATWLITIGAAFAALALVVALT